MGPKRGTRAGRKATLAGLLVVVALAATGCSKAQVIGFGWPKGVTPQAHAMRVLWTWSCIAALIIGVLVWGAMLWAVIFHRKKKGDSTLPRQFQYNLSLETVLTVIPVIIVAVLFYFTTATQNYVLKLDKHPDVKVNVIAFQWNWDFEYPGYQTAQGEPVSTIGTSQRIPMLVVPTNRTIQYQLRSNDVIHSFFVPDFHFKRDVFPDPKKNNQHDKFQNTIDEPGSFVGRCAELCGTYHSMMNFEVRALPPKLFQQYMGWRTKMNSVTGEPYTAAQALRKMDCGKLCVPHAVTTHPFNTDRTAREASGAGLGRDANQ